MAVAHGQMDEGTLEQVVLDFWERRYDVLVCTTIIESGIDMPIGQHAGGRPGRPARPRPAAPDPGPGRAGPDQRAYAYLFHPADRVLTEQAYERLRTIGEHTELGSGFKIAMRDLEIRGAGNLLGADQSGPHRRRRLRPLRPAGGRGGRRGQGRAAARCPRRSPSTSPATPTSRPTTSRPRTPASRPTGAWPATTTPSEVDDVGREWVDRFGPPPAGRRGAARAGPPAGRVPADRGDRRGRDGRPGWAGPAARRPALARHAGRQCPGPAAAAGARRRATARSCTSWSCPSTRRSGRPTRSPPSSPPSSRPRPARPGGERPPPSMRADTGQPVACPAHEARPHPRRGGGGRRGARLVLRGDEGGGRERDDDQPVDASTPTWRPSGGVPPSSATWTRTPP